MSQLHPTEEDEQFAQGHTEAGLRMALNRAWRLTRLLDRARVFCPVSLQDEIHQQLSKSHYDETDDGQWRLEKDGGGELPPQKVRK
jgi:hypothetical protein